VNVLHQEDEMAENSRQLAGLIGPTLMVLSATEALNFKIWSTNIPPNTYLNGIILFVAGLAILRAHSGWSSDWSVLVTLSGWVGIAMGLFRTIAPAAGQAGEGVGIYLVLALMLASGAVLTFKGYWPTPEATSR
jgi:hypothetical protein